MSVLALTGLAGPFGVFGPGGVADATSDKASASLPAVAPVAAVSGAGISKTALLAGGAAVAVLLLMARR